MHKNSERFLHLWPHLARLALGFFFLVSAYLKLTEGFFFDKTSPLASDFQYWISRGWTLPLYRPVLEFFMPYADIIAGFVVLSHCVAAVLLLLNMRVRVAGYILFFVQLNIFLATFLGWGFLVMVGSSLWIALYFICKPSLSPRSWRWLHLGFLLIYFLMILGRYNRGDPWVSEFPMNFAHYQVQVMGSHVAIKHWLIRFSTTAYGSWVWASIWWIHVLLFALLFTKRYRLLAGVGVGILFTGRAMIWMNVLGAEAVVYMLLLFLWLSEEACMQYRFAGPVSLFPREEIRWLKGIVIRFLEPPKPRVRPKKKRRK